MSLLSRPPRYREGISNHTIGPQRLDNRCTVLTRQLRVERAAPESGTTGLHPRGIRISPRRRSGERPTAACRPERRPLGTLPRLRDGNSRRGRPGEKPAEIDLGISNYPAIDAEEGAKKTAVGDRSDSCEDDDGDPRNGGDRGPRRWLGVRPLPRRLEYEAEEYAILGDRGDEESTSKTSSDCGSGTATP